MSKEPGGPSEPGDPAAALPSPPHTKPPFHEFFTPRRQLTTVHLSEENSLPSPEDSPSNRNKRKHAAETLYGGDQRPISFKGLKRETENDEGESSEDEPEIPVRRPVPRKQPTRSMMQLMRSMGLHGDTSFRGFHGGDWSNEVLGIYSRPKDTHFMDNQQPNSNQVLPFTVKSTNTNSLVGIGDETGVVRLLDSGKDERFEVPHFSIMCHDNAIFDLAWSPDDHQMATASGDQSVRITDVMTKKTTALLLGHRSTVKQAAYNPDTPAILASCSRDGNIHIWDLRCVGVPSDDDSVVAQKPVNSIFGAHVEPITGPKKRGWNAKPHIVSVTSLVWAGGDKIFSGSEGNAVVKLWDIKACHTRRKTAVAIESSKLPAHHSQPGHRPFGLNSLSLSRNGSTIYSLCKDSVVYAYASSSLRSGPLHAYTHPRLHASTFYVKTALSRDGTLLATGSSDGVPLVFPTDERYLDKRMYKDHPEGSKAAMIDQHMRVGRGAALVRGHEKEVTDVSWTNDGDLVTISDDYHARCWRIGRDGEAEDMRNGGEDEGRRWGWGWAEVKDV
ncbi:hypothetical protein RUND412_007789 [Rhizina undulata]